MPRVSATDEPNGSYLWPNFEAGAQSRNFVLSVMLLINEKFRERASVWEFVG